MQSVKPSSGTRHAPPTRLAIGAAGIIILAAGVFCTWPERGALQQQQVRNGKAEPNHSIAQDVVRPADEPLDLRQPHLGAGGRLIRFRVKNSVGTWNEPEVGRALIIMRRGVTETRLFADVSRGEAVIPTDAVEGGPWERLEFGGIQLGDRRAVALNDPISLSNEDPLTVDCEFLPLTRLNVIDGLSHLHATELRLVMTGTHLESKLLVPAQEGQLIGNDLTSPIELNDRPGTQVYYVRSPFSAWSRVAIDHDCGGDRTVFLVPGGGVDFDVNCEGPVRSVYLRLYGPNDAVSYDNPAAECKPTQTGFAHLDGLEEGNWAVRAELGPASLNAVVLGSGRFSISSGAVARVKLDVQLPQPAEKAVRVSGVVITPEPLEDSGCTLALEALEPWRSGIDNSRTIPLTQMEPGNGTELRWDAGFLVPGTWNVEVRCVQWGEQWKVEPGRENVFIIDLSDLRHTFVRVLDRTTRVPIPVGQLNYWRANQAEGGAGAGSYSIGPEPGKSSDPISLQSLEGPYRFWVVGQSMGRAEVRTVSLGGPEGLDLLIDSAALDSASLTLMLSSRGTTIPMPNSWWRRVEYWSESGEQITILNRSIRTNSVTVPFGKSVTVELPTGTIEIRFPPTKDFRDILPQTAILQPGASLKLTVEVEPKY